ncbi:MAG: hypothetical protein ABSG46_11195, partial [Candidatus Binataceae bacterium]
MTPQLQQAIKILQLSQPELDAFVQSEVDSNPMLEPLDLSASETAANGDVEEPSAPPADGEPLAAEPEAGAEAASDGEWEPAAADEPLPPTLATEAPDAAVEMGDLNRIDKLDWKEYLENYSNNWQNGEPP